MIDDDVSCKSMGVSLIIIIIVLLIIIIIILRESCLILGSKKLETLFRLKAQDKLDPPASLTPLGGCAQNTDDVKESSNSTG